MQPDNNISKFIQNLEKSLTENHFVKASLGNYKGTTPDLKNIYIKKILIKSAEKLSFTFRYQTRDIVKNYETAQAAQLLQEWFTDGFRAAHLATTQADWQLDIAKKTTLKQTPASQTNSISVAHNREKKRLITPQANSYLFELKLADEQGNVFKNSQDKYKQINHYIEILRPLLEATPKHPTFRVADMGSGKGYLTFALYDYLQNTLHQNSHVTGVEYRPDMVTLCNQISQNVGFAGLEFVQGTIQDFDSEGINMLVALHACDTATDDAIQKGIEAAANLIVVAPCCHKQIRRQIEAAKPQNALESVLRHGIFLERESEMVTDTIRALVLEYFGYKTKVFQFISAEHTAKNVMITAEKRQDATARNPEVLHKIQQLKSYFGIEFHQLEKLLNLI
ncbi:Methyltransferase domain-containing protein [Flexibacter flexilis DSM 6793]|uniref:Methyltransferase domain-containing protein n=1 Tax=Flexibacter flexilis DSM 6793 TaxID=927664 RepID=A0A1I1JPF8_9BACT|nr:SAM-dependent methyltransferase [Flexibacter flexilis]SFC48418.1 Methyltransferase domain-containing protein [Flexibacter flexilis DSM 6793]